MNYVLTEQEYNDILKINKDGLVLSEINLFKVSIENLAAGKETKPFLVLEFIKKSMPVKVYLSSTVIDAFPKLNQ